MRSDFLRVFATSARECATVTLELVSTEPSRVLAGQKYSIAIQSLEVSYGSGRKLGSRAATFLPIFSVHP